VARAGYGVLLQMASKPRQEEYDTSGTFSASIRARNGRLDTSSTRTFYLAYFSSYVVSHGLDTVSTRHNPSPVRKREQYSTTMGT